jgi:hypothetical protein
MAKMKLHIGKKFNLKSMKNTYGIGKRKRNALDKR